MKTAKERWHAFRDKHSSEGDAPVNGVKMRHEHTMKEIDQLYEVIAVLESRIMEIENANQ
jgi:hypothetical protein